MLLCGVQGIVVDVAPLNYRRMDPSECKLYELTHCGTVATNTPTLLAVGVCNNYYKCLQFRERKE